MASEIDERGRFLDWATNVISELIPEKAASADRNDHRVTLSVPGQSTVWLRVGAVKQGARRRIELSLYAGSNCVAKWPRPQRDQLPVGRELEHWIYRNYPHRGFKLELNENTFQNLEIDALECINFLIRWSAHFP